MKIAHIELSNKHKTLGKLQNIRDLEGGWAVLPFKQHPVDPVLYIMQVQQILRAPAGAPHPGPGQAAGDRGGGRPQPRRMETVLPTGELWQY